MSDGVRGGGTAVVRAALDAPPGPAAAAADAALEPWVRALVSDADTRPYRPFLPELLDADLRERPYLAVFAAQLAGAAGVDRAVVDRLLSVAHAAGSERIDQLVAWVTGVVAVRRGDVHTAALAWKRASASSRPGAPEAVIGLVQSIAAANLGHGDVGRALSEMDEAGRIADRVGSHRGAALAAAHQASLFATAGRFREAEVALQRAIERFDTLTSAPLLGDVVLIHSTDALLGALAGDRARAEAAYLRCLVATRGEHAAWFRAVVRTSRAEWLCAADVARSHDDARAAQRAFAAAGDRFYGARARRARAGAAIASGEPEAAWALVEPLLSDEVLLRSVNDRTRVLLVAARARLALGHRREALAMAGDAAAVARTTGATYAEVEALLLRAEADPVRHADDVRRARHLSGDEPAWVHLWSSWPDVRVEQLGTQRVVVGGVSAAFRTEAAHQLVHSLVLAGRQGLTVEELCERFWPGSPEAQALSSLSTTLTHARGALGKEAWRIERRGGVVRLDLDGLEIDDRAARDAALGTGPAAVAAVRALQAPLLPAWRSEPWVQQADADRERLLQLLGDREPFARR